MPDTTLDAESTAVKNKTQIPALLSFHMDISFYGGVLFLCDSVVKYVESFC